jgi:hypothetical protein
MTSCKAPDPVSFLTRVYGSAILSRCIHCFLQVMPAVMPREMLMSQGQAES